MKRSLDGVLGSVLFALGVSALGCAGDAPKHWGQLEQCLIGEPLAKEENVFARLRGVQLAETLDSTGSTADWPKRCAGHASQLYESLPEDGKAGMIKRTLREQLGCDQACAFPDGGHPLPAADKLWEAVVRAELPSVEVPATQKPKPPQKSLTSEDWPLLSSARLVDHEWSAGGELWLLLKGEKAFSFCSLKGGSASCQALEGLPKFNANAKVSFSMDRSEPVVAGSVFEPEVGLVRTGYSIAQKKAAPLFGGSETEAFHGVGFQQKATESQAMPSPEDKPAEPVFELKRLAKGAAQASGSLKLTAAVRGPVVVDDWLVYVERDQDQRPVFKAKELSREGPLFGSGSVEYRGDFPGPFSVCETYPGAAIGAYVAPIRRLGVKAEGKTKLSVVLLEGKAWHAPVVADIPKQVGEFSEFRCGPGWGGLGFVEQLDQTLKVSELVCKEAGCKTSDVSFAVPDLKNMLALGHVHDRLVIVYQSIAGDVRLRVATLAELPKAKSVLAFENADFGGIEVTRPTLMEGDQVYLAFVNEGLRMLAIDGNGGVKPVVP